MARHGRAARNLTFARDDPTRAVVEIPVDGSYQAHSWDLPTGAVIPATEGKISGSTISPDGRWIWWFDVSAGVWLRSRFGSSPKGPIDHPLRLRPAADVRIALGAEGTAVVARPTTAGSTNLSLLPVGRMRPGAEPVFLGDFEDLQGFMRSLDDSFVAVKTPGRVRVLQALTGALDADLPTEHSLGGFTSDGQILLTGPATSRVWNPLSGFSRDVTLTLPEPHQGTVTRVSVDHSGTRIVIEAQSDTEQPRTRVTQVFTGRVSGGGLTAVGPTHGSVTSGSVVGGPQGSVYASWCAPGIPERLVLLTVTPSPEETSDEGVLHSYAPAVGGIG